MHCSGSFWQPPVKNIDCGTIASLLQEVSSCCQCCVCAILPRLVIAVLGKCVCVGYAVTFI